MYHLKEGIKQDPQKRWNLTDRVFFGHGACHILAGVYLQSSSLSGLYAIRIKPIKEFYGNHIFVTDGKTTFDYHGYSEYETLIKHHRKGWSKIYPEWECSFLKVNFDLLDTESLNERKMLGRDQYLHDPVNRALRFINRFSGSKKCF